jgi:cell division protein FtsB
MKATVTSAATSTAYVVVFLLAVVYAFLAFPKGMHVWQEKKREIDRVEQGNTQLRKEVERQKDYIHRLNTNPAAQELEIRKRLKLLHPDEKLYIVDPGAPAKTPSGN